MLDDIPHAYAWDLQTPCKQQYGQCCVPRATRRLASRAGGEVVEPNAVSEIVDRMRTGGAISAAHFLLSPPATMAAAPEQGPEVAMTTAATAAAHVIDDARCL